MAELSDVANIAVASISSGSIRIPRIAMAIPEELLPYWHEDIETFEAGKKGRGVRAKMDISEGQVVIIEHAIAFGDTCTIGDKDMLISFGEKNIGLDSQI